MAIHKPENLSFSDKKFSMIIYGSPGVGKTTLALSAPKPILFDFDHGISRVNAKHRKDTSVCTTYEEVLADIRSADMKNYDTVIIDTGGSFVAMLKDWAFRTRPGCKTKSGDFNGIKGFGEIKNEFASFTENLKTVLNKNIIFIFHSVESADKDGNAVQRLMCEGSAKNTVWTPCDFGGYIQMVGQTRDICFTPEQEFFAKGCHGISGHIRIPTLSENDSNDFITRLFETAKKNITEEQEAFNPKKAAYDNAIAEGKAIIDSVSDLGTANEALMKIAGLSHALTSKKELGLLINNKCKKLGLMYDKVLKRYTELKGDEEQ